jgi:archaellum biogenesis ATPase FlaH
MATDDLWPEPQVFSGGDAVGPFRMIARHGAEGNADFNDELIAYGEQGIIAALDGAYSRDFLQTLDLAALAKTRAKAVGFAIERIAPVGEVTLFTGAGSAGKSLLAQQLCTVSAAALMTCLRLGVASGPAIYLTCEDSAEHLHYRQERLCEALGIDMASLAGKLHLVSLRGSLDIELEGRDEDGNYAPSSAYRRLATTIKGASSKLVMLDNVAHLFAGNENDRHDVTRFVNLLNRLARDTGAAIILVGHPNKGGDDYSGSTAWLNAVRSHFTIEHDPESDVRTIKLGKANYSRKGDTIRFYWQDWAFVHEDDLAPDTRAEIAVISRANSENSAFIRCLAAATDRQRAVSHNPGSNYAPKVFAGMPEAKGHTAKSFASAMERLLHLKTIALDQPLWRGPNRVMKQGVKLAEKCTDPPARTPCTNPHETPGNAARFNPPIDKYITGAALGAAAPDDDLDWGNDGDGND